MGYTSFPFKFPTFLPALFYIYVGYCLNNFLFNKDSARERSRLFIIGAVLAISVCSAVVICTDNKVGMNENQYGNYMIFAITSTLISTAFIVLISNMPILNNRFLLWLGKNTLYIMGFNYACREAVSEFYYFIPVLNRYPMHWSVGFILTFCLCLCCAFAGERIKRISLKKKS